MVVPLVVRPVLVIVVNKHHGGFGGTLPVEAEGQISSLFAGAAKRNLTGTAVHSRAGQEGTPAVVQLGVTRSPVSKSSQGKVLRHQTLLPLSHVEAGILHFELSAGRTTLSLLFGRGAAAESFLLLLLLLLLLLSNKEGAGAHGHVKET